MNDWPPFMPYLILAFICGLASVVIAFIIALILFNGGHASDVGICAMAAMVFAPAAMGVGIACFMARNDR